MCHNHHPVCTRELDFEETEDPLLLAIVRPFLSSATPMGSAAPPAAPLSPPAPMCPTMPETIEVPTVDLLVLLLALEDLQLESLSAREEGAIENLRDAYRQR